MSASQPNCPACKVRMDEGFVLDFTQHSSFKSSEWVSGKPQPSFWTGLKLKGHEKLPIVAFRCPSCGMLLHYAL